MTTVDAALSNDAVGMLDRLSAILETFGQDKVLGISEMARRANLPKSTVSRIAAELVEQQWLDRIGNDFYIGLNLYELGQAVEQPRRLRELAHPLIARLRAMTGESVHLSVLDGAAVVRVSAAVGRVPLPARFPLGERVPAHMNAAGKALLAFSPNAPQVDFAQTARTPKTILDQGVLQRQLAEVRRTRTAFDQEESVLGVSSVASPVLGVGGTLIGAVAIVGRAESLDTQVLGRAVRSAAQSLSRRINAVVDT